MNHPVAGPLAMEFSTFAVDGRSDLNMVGFTPATQSDVDKIRALLKSEPSKNIEARNYLYASPPQALCTLVGVRRTAPLNAFQAG